jgi:hypothetical protein
MKLMLEQHDGEPVLVNRSVCAHTHAHDHAHAKFISPATKQLPDSATHTDYDTSVVCVVCVCVYTCVDS